VVAPVTLDADPTFAGLNLVGFASHEFIERGETRMKPVIRSYLGARRGREIRGLVLRVNLTLQSLEIIPWLGHWWSNSRGHVSEGRCLSITYGPPTRVTKDQLGRVGSSRSRDHAGVQLASAFTVNGQQPP